MKKLFSFVLMVCSASAMASTAFAATPIVLGPNDSLLMTKILKLVGVANSGTESTAVYGLGSTRCKQNFLSADGLPSYVCETETNGTQLNQEVSATLLFEALRESGVAAREDAVSSLIELVSASCAIDTSGAASCTLNPAVDPDPQPTSGN